MARSRRPSGREPIWWAEKTVPRFGAKSNERERVLEDDERALLLAGQVAAAAVPARRRPDRDDLAGAGGAGQLGHRHERVAERRDPGRVEA